MVALQQQLARTQWSRGSCRGLGRGQRAPSCSSGASEALPACTPGEDGTGTGPMGRALVQDPLPAAAILTARCPGLQPRLRAAASAWPRRHAGYPACRGRAGQDPGLGGGALALLRPPTKPGPQTLPGDSARCTRPGLFVHALLTLPEALTPVLWLRGDLVGRSQECAQGGGGAGGWAGVLRELGGAEEGLPGTQGRAGAAEERGLKQRRGRRVGARWRQGVGTLGARSRPGGPGRARCSWEHPAFPTTGERSGPDLLGETSPRFPGSSPCEVRKTGCPSQEGRL